MSLRLRLREIGKLMSLILPTADREMMSLFLEQVAMTFAEDLLVCKMSSLGQIARR
jgi:hypothetical protein